MAGTVIDPSVTGVGWTVMLDTAAAARVQVRDGSSATIQASISRV